MIFCALMNNKWRYCHSFHHFILFFADLCFKEKFVLLLSDTLYEKVWPFRKSLALQPPTDDVTLNVVSEPKPGSNL